jgi:hypothetical protein
MRKISGRDLERRIIDIGSFRSFISALEETPDWLASVGESSRVFAEMMDDGRIASLVENRQNRVLWLDMAQRDGGHARQNRASAAAIDYNKQQKICTQLLNAIPFGVAVSEVIWEKEGGLYVPADFRPIPRALLGFPLTGEGWRTPVYTPTGRPLEEPRKFIIHRNDRGTGNPWGRPAPRAAYWPWKF